MEVRFHAGGSIAEVTGGAAIRTGRDALELAFDPALGGAMKLILPAAAFDPQFLDLKSGLAGEVLQKFVNYHLRVAIVGDWSTVTSESLAAFIRESNKGRHVTFAASAEEAVSVLARD
jgi:hypothetical protein